MRRYVMGPSGSAPEESRRWPTRSNLNAISFVALLVGAVAVFAGGVTIAEAFGETVNIRLQSSTPVPATHFVTGVPMAIPAVTGGGYETAAVEVFGLNVGSRVLLAAAAVVGTLATVFVALTIAYLCQRLRRGDPFVSTLSRATFAASLTLMIGGVFGQGLSIAAAWLASDELNAARHSNEFIPGGPADYTPVIAGIVLGVIAAAFRVGERMQRDTEGLV